MVIIVGSGVSGLYSGTYGANLATEGAGTGDDTNGSTGKRNSRPYASSYRVISDMLRHDKN